MGDAQVLKAAPSRLHSNVAPDLLDEKVNVTELSLTAPDGPEVIVVSTGASTVQVLLAGVASMLPAPSLARAWKLWLPSAKPAYTFGDAQVLKAALSKLHSKVELVSLDEKLNVAELLLAVPDGPESIWVSGGVVSAGAKSILLWR